MSAGTGTITYGSLDDQGEGGDGSFDPMDAYYVKEKPLTPAERKRKCFLLAVPIAAAVLIIGGFTLFLLRDFGYLYPRHTNGNTKEPSRSGPVYEDDGKTSEKHGSSSSSSSPPNGIDGGIGGDMASACFAHDKCSGLVGECCPTLDGIFLGCCN